MILFFVIPDALIYFFHFVAFVVVASFLFVVLPVLLLLRLLLVTRDSRGRLTLSCLFLMTLLRAALHPSPHRSQ